jgi:hypothetical protein
MTSPSSPLLDSIDSTVLPTPFVENYSPPGSTDGIVSDDQVSRSSDEDSAATHTESQLHSASSSSTTSQSSDGSGTDRSDASKEQSLLVGVDGVQRKRYRIPRGKNVNVADHERSDEATSEEQTSTPIMTDGDIDPACNPGAAAPADDPIAVPDGSEPQIMETSSGCDESRPSCLASLGEVLVISSSDTVSCRVDEHRDCKLILLLCSHYYRNSIDLPWNLQYYDKMFRAA